MGVASLLCAGDSVRLVSSSAISARSSARLSALETSNRLRETPAASWHSRARCLAVWKLAQRFSEPGLVNLPVKHSIAVLIRKGDRILAVRRPDDDDELPGIWGLPAGSFRSDETLEDLIARVGRDKLGVSLTPVRKLGAGTQDREHYRLEMELWEVAVKGTPAKSQWQWTQIETLKAGSRKGSLCCRLALELNA